MSSITEYLRLHCTLASASSVEQTLTNTDNTKILTILTIMLRGESYVKILSI